MSPQRGLAAGPAPGPPAPSPPETLGAAASALVERLEQEAARLDEEAACFASLDGARILDVVEARQVFDEDLRALLDTLARHDGLDPSARGRDAIREAARGVAKRLARNQDLLEQARAIVDGCLTQALAPSVGYSARGPARAIAAVRARSRKA